MAQNLSRTGSLKARAAPGSLRLVQAFVNTRDVETGLEELWNPDALAEWLAGPVETSHPQEQRLVGPVEAL